jgi:hypothetical protein
VDLLPAVPQGALIDVERSPLGFGGVTVYDILAWIWLAGVAAMLIYAVVSYVRLVRRKDSVTTPFVYGFIKPKIHIPSGLSDEQLRYVTLHEQTHIKRRDYLVKLLAFAIISVHWFNPLAWAAFVLLCADMETSCDERVLRELGMGAKADYSQTLLSLAVNRRILSASPLAFGEGGIKDRVRNVLSFQKRSRVIIGAAIALAIALTVGFAVNRANETDGRLAQPYMFHDIVKVIEVESLNSVIVEIVEPDVLQGGYGNANVFAAGELYRAEFEFGQDLLRTAQPGDLFSVSRGSGITIDKSREPHTYHSNGITEVTQETPAPSYDPNSEFENKFEVNPSPERYTPAMSSAPGILLGIDGQASGQPAMTYECESGSFFYWENGEITNFGNKAEVEFGSQNLYWTPDADTKDGDMILMQLVDENSGVMAAQGLTVRVDGIYYTLERSSPAETLPPTKNYITAAPAAWSPDTPLGAAGVPSLDYASDKYMILHDYFGMFVFELDSHRIIRSLDLAAIGCQYTQGSDACEVAVSADGGKVYMRTMETRKMYVWDLTAEPEVSLYTGDFKQDWPTEPFKTVSIDAAVGAAYNGNYGNRAVDFGGYYGYLYASNGENIGGLWYCVSDMVYTDLFSERTSTAFQFLAAPYIYGVDAKEITAVLTNNTFNEKDVTCGEGFVIERLYRGNWISVSLKDNFAWLDIAYLLPVGASKTFTVKTEWLKEPLEPGSYRLSTDVHYDETSPKNKVTVYAEFSIM